MGFPTLSYFIKKRYGQVAQEVDGVGSMKNRIQSMTEPLINSMGYELVDVDYVKEGKEWYLRFYVDSNSPAGMTLDDCEKISHALSEFLDHEDPVPHGYNLQVSSPGIERPLKKPSDFARFTGQCIRLKTFQAIDGRRNWKGEILSAGKEGIVLRADGTDTEIPYHLIVSARLVVHWER